MEENIINTSLKEKEKLVIAKKKRERNKFFIISVISVILFLIIWQLITDVFKLFPSYSLPSPFTVFKSFIYKLTNKAPDNGRRGFPPSPLSSPPSRNASARPSVSRPRRQDKTTGTCPPPRCSARRRAHSSSRTRPATVPYGDDGSTTPCVRKPSQAAGATSCLS